MNYPYDSKNNLKSKNINTVKNIISILILTILIFLSSCTIKTGNNLIKETGIEVKNIEDVQVIELDEGVPMKSQYVGSIKVGKSSYNLNCDYYKIINKCKKIAIKSGANIVKIVKVKSPDFLSSCFRVEAKIYVNQSSEYLEGLPIAVDHTLAEESILDKLQGLRQGKFVFYNAEGYDITLFNSQKPYTSKTLNSLKKKFKVSKEDLGSRSDKIAPENLIFEASEIDDNITTTKSTYIYANTEGTTSVVEFKTTLGKLDSFEKTVLKLIIENRIPSTVYTRLEVDSIQFANRFIKLGPVCQWQNVRNLQCPYLGQMDWSEFSSKERADKYLQQRIKILEEKKLSEFIDKSEVSVAFEGVDVVAKKYTLKVKVPKFLTGGSNTLTIYYVAAKIEDEYIASVLSYYDNDINAPDLPPLISEVMHIK